MLAKIKSLDWLLLGVVLLLFTTSLVSIYASSMVKNDYLQFKKQIISFIFAIIIFILFTSIDYKIFKDNSLVVLVFYLTSLFLLAVVFIFGIKSRGSSSWLKFGDFYLQPSELAKLTLIILLAKYFSIRHIEIKQIKHIIISGIYSLIPFGLIILQPDLGSALIIFLIWLGMIIIAGIDLKPLLIIFLICILVASSAWFFYLKDYQKNRIISFINPSADPLGKNYNTLQSIIAIGSGKIFGRGLGQGPQSQLKFLPEKHTDFIFASLAEELGFVGVIIIIGAYLVFISRIMKIINKTQNNFGRLFCIGYLIFIIVHVFINIGMNLGIVPVIGISLPLISAGGSNLITVFMGLGIIQSIKIREENFRESGKSF